jgi:hypothetical protein
MAFEAKMTVPDRTHSIYQKQHLHPGEEIFASNGNVAANWSCRRQQPAMHLSLLQMILALGAER